jgi:hypothetical protein
MDNANLDYSARNLSKLLSHLDRTLSTDNDALESARAISSPYERQKIRAVS